MKKIGTISVNACSDGLNYGTVFLNYALCKYLNQFDNVKAENIDYLPPTLERINRKYPFLSYLKLGKFKLAILYFLGMRSRSKRYEKFKTFVKKNIRQSQLYTTDSLTKTCLTYDIVVCGSDTIWSSNLFDGKFVPAYFLHLPNMKNIKKVSYSASVDDRFIFDEKEDNQIKNMLSDFSAISCREKILASHIQTLTNLPVEHTVDPVFLLPKSEYEKIMSKRLIEDKYLLAYFVLSKNYRKNITLAKNYAKKHNLRIIEVSKYPWHNIGHKTISDASPQEFLSLIYYADIVFSDTFHGTCFSIIFEKEFYVFYKETAKRVPSICKELGLLDRLIKDDCLLCKETKIDYYEVNKKINKWVTKSKDYINKNIIG